MNLLLPLLIIAITPGVPIDQRYPDAQQVFYCDFCKSWDKNFDAWPDGWTRRRGAGYPHFVEVKIRNEPSPVGDHCLKINLNAAAAVAYGPVVEISPMFSYVLEGQLKTEGLDHDRAFMSLTLLDGKRRRLKTYYSPAFRVTDGWRKVSIGPIAPQNEQVRGAVIGLHLQPRGGEYAADGPVFPAEPGGAGNADDTAGEDISGAALFDDIWLGRLPRMSLSTNSPGGVFTAAARVRLRCRASGFAQSAPRVEFFLEDHDGRQIATHECALATAGSSRHDETLLDGFSDEPVGRMGTATWEPPVNQPGFYRVRAEMKGVGHLRTIHRRQELSFVLIEDTSHSPNSEFGWSLPRGDKPLPLPDLLQLLSQMGVGYVKYPLWYGQSRKESEIEGLYHFAERLNARGIALIGVLGNPPEEVAAALAEKDNLRAAEIFTSNPAAWLPSLEAVLIRFANQVSWWQLGEDRDASFVDCVNLNANITKVKAELDGVDLDVSLGIVWNWMNQLPRNAGPRNAGPQSTGPQSTGQPPAQTAQPTQPAWRFISLAAEPPFTHEELATYLSGDKRPTDKAADSAGPTDGNPELAPKLSVVLQPIAKGRYSMSARINDLVRRMMTAKINGAATVTLSDPFDERHGLFDAEGMPGELLLPWRVTAQSLKGSRYLGKIQLPNQSDNRIFSRGDQAIMAVWNEKPTEEVIYLGENVYQIDVWGRKTTPQREGNRQIIRVGPTPSFVIGLNKSICLWRMGVEFERSRIASIPGRAQQNSFRFKNTFPGGVAGQLQLVMDKSWRVHPSEISLSLAGDEQGEQPFTLMLPYDVVTGIYDVRVDCTVQAKETRRFSVYRTTQVGLGDVYIEHSTKLDDEGNLIVGQRFVNNSRHRVSYRCGLSAPGRRRMGTRIVNLPRGSNQKTYVLPNGKELIGKTLWLRATEIDGRRKLNYKFVVEDRG